MGFWSRQRSWDSNSSNGSKENPLVDHDYNNSGMIIHKHRGRVIYGDYEEERESFSCCKCIFGCFFHLFILFVPILCMAINVTFLAVLAAYDQHYLQEGDIYGDETYQDLAKVYFNSVSADSISLVMSQYAPYRDVLALSSTGAILATIVTLFRTIQIDAYHKRAGSFVFMTFLNYVATIINIAAYIGLMVAVNFKATQEEPAYAATAHLIGFLTFFAGTTIYAVLHTFLLWNQDYPWLVKFLFYIFAVAILGSSLAFGIPIWENGMDSDKYSDPVYEWIAVFASAISMGFYFLFFAIDPCDDELGAFLCGGKARHQKFKERGMKHMSNTYSV